MILTEVLGVAYGIFKNVKFDPPAVWPALASLYV